jgi:teichuronic acid biosynthesis protein TuaE
MVEAAPTRTAQTKSAATTAVLLVAGALVTVALTAFALRGHTPRTHAALALGLPLATGVFLVLAATRRQWARLSIRRLLTVVVIALPALAILGPVFALPQLRQLFAFRVALAFIGVAGAIWLILTRPRWRLEAATFAFLYGAWLCWLVITLSWAPYPKAGLRYLFLFVALGALAIATASAGTSRRRLNHLMLALGSVYGLSLLIGLAEIALHRHLPTASPKYAHRATPAGFFFNTNDFATYLVLCWPYALLLPYFRRTSRSVALCIAALLLTIGVLLFTGSRDSLLALGVEVLIVAVLLTLRAGRRARAAVAILIVVFLFGMGFLLTGHGGRLGASFKVTQLVGQIEHGGGSGGVRTELQIAGLRAAATRFFLGVGPGNAEPIVAQQNPSFTVINLHDWYLEVFVDGGLPGLLLFLLIYVLALSSMVRVARYARDPLLRYLGLSTAIALAGFFVAIVGPSTPIKFPPMAILFGLAIAILICARREDRGDIAGAAPAIAGLPSGRHDLLDSPSDSSGRTPARVANGRRTLEGDDAKDAGEK